MQTHQLILQADSVEPAELSAGSGACFRYRNSRIELRERTLGDLRGENLRVKMLHVGICGTDAHLLECDPVTGAVLSSVPTQISPGGRVLGHEGVGQVIECGPAVKNFRPGNLVAFISVWHCGFCKPCRQGYPNQCEQSQLLGTQIDGVFGTIVDVPSRNAVDVTELQKHPDGLVAAACLEPLAVALLAGEEARVSSTDRVAIFGAGPIGLYLAMLARKAWRAAHITVIEPLAARRALAQDFAHAVCDPIDFANQVGEWDVVFEASGNLTNITHVLRRVAARGRIILLGRNGQPLAIDAVDHIITRAITLAGSRGQAGGVMERARNLVLTEQIRPSEIVTHRAHSLSALGNLLANDRERVRQNGKIVVSL